MRVVDDVDELWNVEIGGLMMNHGLFIFSRIFYKINFKINLSI